MKFTELRLIEPVVRAVADAGYTSPTPIQIKAIPIVVSGRDVLGCAQTGTGKTGAFALPLLSRLGEHTKPRGYGRPKSRVRAARALVLCPTRELATQIFDSFKTYGRHLNLAHTVIFGGVSKAPQIRDLRAGVDTIIATPGRLLDLCRDGLVDLSQIESLVLDEADHMLDMGFIRDIRRIIDLLPERRQTLLFSATMPPEIRTLADSILDDPEFVQSAPIASPVDAIDQSVHLIPRDRKQATLERLLKSEDSGRTLIFTRTKHGADKVVRALGRAGIASEAIHGNKAQNARTRTLKAFRSGKLQILVATDIAARGIDVDEITHVFNYDIPDVAETYVHRIGRTARAGSTGIAISFCDQDETKNLRAIERLMKRELPVAENGLGPMTRSTRKAPARRGPARSAARPRKNSAAPSRKGRRTRARV